jgi:hypothetical protein
VVELAFEAGQFLVREPETREMRYVLHVRA